MGSSTTSQITCFSKISRRRKNCAFPSPSLRPQFAKKPTLKEERILILMKNKRTRIWGQLSRKRAAKIHDFCFGIPFGWLVLSRGLIGFVFSRNLVTLSSGLLYGGALLALSTFSLKIWRQGKSSLPYILGQGALAAALLWKNFQTFSLTKKVFPTGFYAVISGAMLCFYSYVLLSGGNPPPKKLKSSASAAS